MSLKKLLNILTKRSVEVNFKTEVIDPYLTTQRDFTKEEKEEIFFVRNYTMTSDERLVTLSRSIKYLFDNDIEGDIVECGVWRGGSMMLAANKLRNLKCLNKKIFLFDTFQGMTEPSEVDIAWDSISAQERLVNEPRFEGRNAWCYSTLDEVKSNLFKTQYPKENIFFIEGKVENTLPSNLVDKISLLRLDTDWYESTKHELECLFDKLVVGGILIIDDYGHWQGAKKAVDEFIKERKLKLFLNRIDYTGRLAIKI